MNVRLKELRLARNLSQESLAEMVGIDRSMLSKIENGASCSMRVALNIAKTLGTTVEHLFSPVVNDGEAS